MMYASPELLVIGRAEALVLGADIFGVQDRPDSLTKPAVSLALGLDD